MGQLAELLTSKYINISTSREPLFGAEYTKGIDDLTPFAGGDPNHHICMINHILVCGMQISGSIQRVAMELPKKLISHPKNDADANHWSHTSNSRSLNRILIEAGAVSHADMFSAVTIQESNHTPLEQILLAHGWVAPDALLYAQALHSGMEIIDPEAIPPEHLLIDMIGLEFCLSHDVLPWQRVNGTTWIAVSETGCNEASQDKLRGIFGEIHLVLCSKEIIHRVILQHRKGSLVYRAETCVPAKQSCRNARRRVFDGAGLIAMTLLALSLFWAPLVVLVGLLLGVFFGLLLQTILKLLCFWTAWRMSRRKRKAPLHLLPERLPMISVMVPLYKESEIADHLVQRLLRLKYPRELSDVILLLEEDDEVTRLAIEDADLPNWFRVIFVPEGAIKTKPRALNYGLNFCKGDIVGVWDAEDKPLPDQLHQIAGHFYNAAPDLGCVQGILDYYNPRTNWISRCFTIEYAAWFRVLLPAMAKLGLIVPLGGTTCFFRREALKEVRAWDAWNVTEDADLGVRLARYGWRVETVETCTDEEANCRSLPWIRQRSRWLKGYILTWSVHMREPVKLWRELGPVRFIGFQVQFLAMIGQVFFAPAVWGFWLLSFGLSYPLNAQFRELFGPSSITVMCILLIGSELVNILIGLYATSAGRHRHLRKWVVTTYFYFPLGCFALWKAGYEIFTRPFYWDKTAHGIFAETPVKNGPEETLVEIPFLGSIGEQDLKSPKGSG